MEAMKGLGSAVGEYIGDGKGESEEPPAVDVDVSNTGDLEADVSEDEEDDRVNDAQPLLIFYDCETTGLSIYNDHLTDIAAKVIGSPVPLNNPTFSSLVMTSRRIPAAGMVSKQHV